MQYAALIPGLAAVFVFAARTTHVAQYSDVSKQQWILLMWFRLDFMCIMSVVALCGAGAWLVAGCMFAVALYLAHRVMRIEKRLATSHMRRSWYGAKWTLSTSICQGVSRPSGHWHPRMCKGTTLSSNPQADDSVTKLQGICGGCRGRDVIIINNNNMIIIWLVVCLWRAAIVIICA
ncbi:hypothetical protein C3747_72g136 [Trypanosoma cruzi]|uniref:Uncharacterized protein n=1 Tax=Trypanosoma cruzi TaxID=5693 RepID=A0A2V2WNB0_TRYCR|nr:hypothetical protein C3747_72g136 [Trypanosoma cruzi]